MAAYTSQPTRSRRFVKVYLTGWAFAAVGALAYLAVLAFQPTTPTPPRAQVTDADPGQAMRALAKAAVEMGTMRRNLSEVQKDVADLKDAAVQNETKEKTVASRLTAVEERLASMDAESAAPKAKATDKTKGKAAPEQRPSARVINFPQGEAVPPTAKAEGPPVPLETGSIQPSNEEITFGAPVVTPAAPTAFGVQLAAHPSLEGLRERWDRLREAHSGQLSALEPRIVPPRTGGGAYRLLAGPFATKAEADRACTDMGMGRPGCFSTPYTGAPL
jgi:SPOR domain